MVFAPLDLSRSSSIDFLLFRIGFSWQIFLDLQLVATVVLSICGMLFYFTVKLRSSLVAVGNFNLLVG